MSLARYKRFMECSLALPLLMSKLLKQSGLYSYGSTYPMWLKQTTILCKYSFRLMRSRNRWKLNEPRDLLLVQKKFSKMKGRQYKIFNSLIFEKQRILGFNLSIQFNKSQFMKSLSSSKKAMAKMSLTNATNSESWSAWTRCRSTLEKMKFYSYWIQGSILRHCSQQAVLTVFRRKRNAPTQEAYR